MGKAGTGIYHGKKVKRAKRGGGTFQNSAKATTKLSVKQRLAKHGKMTKKGERGVNSAFMTRSTILRRLQLTLKDFRRLCILKGVYPRDPPKAMAKGKDKVYYSVQDVAHLAHEPLVAKFREFKALMTKVRRSAGRRDVGDARRRHEGAPQYTLYHLVRERYPRFELALDDLDDCLSLVYLFATLPGAGRVTPEHTATCKGLCRAWENAVALSGGLTKAFISIKGVYFSADVEGKAVTWLVPHAFTQAVPRDVDLRVMVTFLEFYETLLKTVCFRLYKKLELPFPPLECATTSRFLKLAAPADRAPAGVFAGLTVELAREASYGWLDFALAAAGATVADGATDPGDVTHVVRDRGAAPPGEAATRDAVQPQWVVDCLNKRKLLPAAPYAPGAALPSHLSPFFDYDDSLPEDHAAPAAGAAARAAAGAAAGAAGAGGDDGSADGSDDDGAGADGAGADGEDAQKAMAKMMMSKKAKRLYERMQHGLQRKQQAVDKLRQRRAKLARGA